MWTGTILNWFSILKFSVILFAAQTATSTLSTLVIGVDDLSKQTVGEFFVYQYLPSVLVGLVVLIFYAKQQFAKTLLHLTIAVIVSMLLGHVVVSLLQGSLYIAPTWVIDLPIAVVTILLATFIGGFIRGSEKHATGVNRGRTEINRSVDSKTSKNLGSNRN